MKIVKIVLGWLYLVWLLLKGLIVLALAVMGMSVRASLKSDRSEMGSRPGGGWNW